MVGRVDLNQRAYNNAVRRQRMRVVSERNAPRPRTAARERETHYVDYSLIFTVIVLIAFGLLMLYSTSSYNAALTMGDPSYYFKHQLGATALGAVVMTIAAFIPYRVWKKLAVPAYVFSIVSILLVLSPIGMEINYARRWIKVFGVSVQPAEIAKVGIIIFLAALCCKFGKKMSTLAGKGYFMGSAVVICALLYIVTDNLSSAIIVFGIALTMLFVATPEYRYFIVIGLTLFTAAALTVYLITHVDAVAEATFRLERIRIWLNPEAYEKGYQTVQGLYAIGSGGILGKGLGQSMQKLGFVPEAQNDMIFSIICEELGLFGAFLVIFLFVVLIWRLFVIATNAPDRFGAMLSVGVMAHIMIQVILNIAVVTNTIPNTGITLPFISYGGTSILFLMAEIGLALSVARSIRA